MKMKRRDAAAVGRFKKNVQLTSKINAYTKIESIPGFPFSTNCNNHYCNPKRNTIRIKELARNQSSHL